ncbi:MAG: alcohol dehydrogenase catalytic domain-containing protein [Owenweeksia sp.]|nr:alcohol dehydrogenase catalytic domain-containing protein [Owenweeksia sp.]
MREFATHTYRQKSQKAGSYFDELYRHLSYVVDDMKAIILTEQRESLKEQEVAKPTPNPDQVLIKVKACGVCRTDLHVVDGDLPKPKLPLIPGHEVIGEVVELGENADRWKVGDKVGMPWLGYTCGKCKFCQRGQENLCENALFNGYTLDGGYAEYTTAYADYCLPIPDQYYHAESTPCFVQG